MRKLMENFVVSIIILSLCSLCVYTEHYWGAILFFGLFLHMLMLHYIYLTK